MPLLGDVAPVPLQLLVLHREQLPAQPREARLRLPAADGLRRESVLVQAVLPCNRRITHSRRLCRAWSGSEIFISASFEISSF